MKRFFLFKIFMFLPFLVSAQNYSIENEIIKGRIVLQKGLDDTVLAEVTFANKTNQAIYFCESGGNYMAKGDSYLYLYIGWDQIKVSNVIVPIEKLEPKNKIEKQFKIVSNQLDEKQFLFFGLNYILESDVSKIIIKENGENQIEMNNYLMNMRWSENTFPICW